MQYTGKLFFPRGAELKLEIDSLSPIQGQTAHRLYAQFKQAMNDDTFDAKVESDEAVPPVLLRFQRVGQTAGCALFYRRGDDSPRLEAAAVLLPGLDRAEDMAALDQLQASPELSMIDPSDWQDARDHEGPLAAAFFTSEASLNDPLLHGLMSLLGAAFLDRLGLLA